MLLQPVHRNPWQRHPLLMTAAVAVAVWLVYSGAQVFVAVVGLAWLAVAVRRRRRANALRDAGLRARAEYEHGLNLSGDPLGIYGRYPPVQAGWFPDPQNRCQLRYFDGAVWTGYTAVSTFGQ
ncbi:DUF2510 domain-containing protein [Mycolicibacterium sp. 120270]|uniref:DUF2510 domain-containing protein n=1 Tax=Mycolicibacterium sp. 120270 TaxID=3090600 RepID=UPI00299E787C|nr:DUF2510 domain-containing protein [Mycolicibacterium sp. 120270]MDX1885683.1 DUF2510 domain-containing protein [Mycolicibacterium sp. 120270]